MPPPRIRSTDDRFQNAFDAYSDYLEGLEAQQQQDMDLEGRITGATPIDVKGDGQGGVIITTKVEEFDLFDKWQLLRLKDNLYIEPGRVHFKETGEAIHTDLIPYWENTTSLVDATRPFWTLPLTKNAGYTVYLVVDENHTPSMANVYLIEDGVGDILDNAYSDSTSTIIILHEFTTTDDVPYGGDTSPGGYPKWTDISQRQRSDIVLGDVSGQPYHFEVIEDDTYSPSANERRLAIRGGTWTRSAFEIDELPITAPPAALSDFAAAGGEDYTDLAVSISPLADGDYAYVYLALYDDVDTNTWNPIAPTDCVGKWVTNTGTPPARPTEPFSGNIKNWFKGLSTVFNNGGILEFFPHWVGGNIKDYELIPDGEPMDSTLTPRGESLNFVPLGSGMKAHAQIKDFHTLDDQQTDDAKAVYAQVASGGDAEAEFRFPVQIDDGGGLRPRNDFDGSSASTDVIVSLANAAGPPPSYAQLNYTERVFEVDNAALEIEAESGSQSINVEIIQVDWDDFVGTPDLHHDETDPKLGNDPYASIDWEENPDQDRRYWPAESSSERGGGTYGTDSRSYFTTASVRAGELALEDDPSNNLWNDLIFRADTDDVYIEANAGDASLIAFDDVIVTAGVDITLEAEQLVDIIGDTGVDVTATTGDIDIGAAAAAVNITAGTYIDVDPVGEFRINGNAGATLSDSGSDVFQKGVFLNLSNLTIRGPYRLNQAGPGAPEDVFMLGRL